MATTIKARVWIVCSVVSILIGVLWIITGDGLLMKLLGVLWTLSCIGTLRKRLGA
jgi:hypothetical protein